MGNERESANVFQSCIRPEFANENCDARLRLNAQMRQRMARRVDFPERLFLSFFSPFSFFLVGYNPTYFQNAMPPMHFPGVVRRAAAEGSCSRCSVL